MKIIFMGTPEFAVPILKSLIESDYLEIIAVYTQPPRAANRGQKLQFSPIYELAKNNNISIFCPHSLKKSPEEQEKLLAMKPDKIVVAAYGLILPKLITDSIACINIHPSSLPRYRGAAPIQRTIAAGDRETSICIMRMNEFMDEGDILLSEKINLSGQERFEDLSQDLAEKSTIMLAHCLKNYENIQPLKQSTEGITHAAKITKEESLINWQEDARQIERNSRAFSPSPRIYFEYNDVRIKIIEAEVKENNVEGEAGLVIDDKLSIQCGKNILVILKVQKSGGKVLETKDFLRGFKIEKGTKL